MRKSLRTPPKLPLIQRLGLGTFGALFLDLVFPSPVSDGTLPPWYQPAPPPSEPPVMVFDKNLPMRGAYRVFYDAELFNGGGRTDESFIYTRGPISDFYEEAVLPGLVWAYGVRFTLEQPGNIFELVGSGIMIGRSVLWGTDIPLERITNPVGAINIKRNSLRITKIENVVDDTLVKPIPSPTGPTPPYALTRESPNSPPLTSPGPQNPNPFNPVPFGPPGTTPSFNPFPKPGKKNTDEQNEPLKKENTPPWFSPFPALDPPFKEPFDFNPTDTPKTRGPYLVNDPVLDFALNRPPNPLAHPVPIPDPAPIPATDLIPNGT
ncbi:hypothetical protein [Microcystis sp. LE19-195.1E]|jgi:hypothetical protein|uniref:hypothetical protein n=1 Tax=Microcystis sp. LE19-195.1E TaxID=3016440 RepID=UPI0022BFEB34|nr:hypothetical protein [Microcystis sp. LE19-195.1E]MCZ8248648.1 hypothetical protein [Microcystis sp. LE19-195.1E]